jgi:hypothetical protein
MANQRHTKEQIELARKLYLEIGNVEKVPGFSRSSVHRWCRDLIEVNNKKRNKDIGKARKLYLKGFDCPYIAKIFNVTRGAVELWCKGIMRNKSECKLGERNGSWRGGISKLRDVLRKTKEYKSWYMSVLRRDEFKCTECDSKKKLEIHHKKPVSLFPELRINMDNAVTLCRECHTKTESYLIPIKQLRAIYGMQAPNML